MFGNDETSPTARALLTLELLQTSPGIGATALADRLGVTERATRRYVAILREAGIPIESARGRYGGYRVGRGLRLAPLMFTPPEALGLVMAVLDGHHDLGDPGEPVASAVGKIVRALPQSLGDQVDAIRRSTAPAPDRAAARPDAGITLTLVRACAQRRRLRVEYRTEAGSQWSVDVDPWSVVVRHGRWYLLCFSHRVADRRAYRVDRIGSARMLDETADPPAGLDPVAALEEQLAVGWEYEVEIVVDAPAPAVTRCVPATLGRIAPVDERRCRLTGSTSDPRWYAEQLAGIPAPFRVVRGSQVRAALRAVGERMVRAAETD